MLQLKVFVNRQAGVSTMSLGAGLFEAPCSLEVRWDYLLFLQMNLFFKTPLFISIIQFDQLNVFQIYLI